MRKCPILCFVLLQLAGCGSTQITDASSSGNGNQGGASAGGASSTASGGTSAPSTGSGGVTDNGPLSLPPTCSSMSTWTGDEGSAIMNPGEACIACHLGAAEGAPIFSVAGTVFKTGHEPDLCDGMSDSGLAVVIVGADGKQLTLTPNEAGNFRSVDTIQTPYRAKVSYQGRERAMAETQTSGDCNSCHTQNGANGAPGRITAP